MWGLRLVHMSREHEENQTTLRKSREIDQHVGPKPRTAPAHCLCYFWHTQAAPDTDSTFQDFPLGLSAAQALTLGRQRDLLDILCGSLLGLAMDFERRRQRPVK